MNWQCPAGHVGRIRVGTELEKRASNRLDLDAICVPCEQCEICRMEEEMQNDANHAAGYFMEEFK